MNLDTTLHMKTLRAAWEEASVGALREAAYKLPEHGDQRRIEAIHDGDLPSDVYPRPRVGNSPHCPPEGKWGGSPRQLLVLLRHYGLRSQSSGLRGEADAQRTSQNLRV